ncbi:MAG: cytochrome b N-terminal domain-containing protein [Anaerolineae bacterium]
MQLTRALNPLRWPGAILDWVDERIGVRGLIAASLHVIIPRSAHTWYLGGITLFCFMVQATTGILLALYYQPTPATAYDSVLVIMNQLNFGWLIRSVHAWSANLMIVFCVLHLLRIVLQGAYKKPREMTWMVGMILLFVTLGFGFTGYLLPWDQRAFWATTVGTDIAGSVPVIGDFIKQFLRGGADVGAQTLSRFFGVHVLILPAALLGLLGVHLLIIHQQGLHDPEVTE